MIQVSRHWVRFVVVACAAGVGVSAFSAGDYSHYLRKAQEKSFFIQNQHHSGVISLDNGVQYRVVNPGVGSSLPSKNDEVSLRYSVRYLNGQPIQSMSDVKKLHITMKELSPVIRSIVNKMAPGSIVQVFVPDHLVAQIGKSLLSGPSEANQALIFKLKLLNVSHT